MLQKITIELLDYPPFDTHVRVWAWVQDGLAIHKAINHERKPSSLDRWTITQMRTGRGVSFPMPHTAVIDIFCRARAMTIDGIPLAELTHEQARNASPEARAEAERLYWGEAIKEMT